MRFVDRKATLQRLTCRFCAKNCLYNCTYNGNRHNSSNLSELDTDQNGYQSNGHPSQPSILAPGNVANLILVPRMIAFFKFAYSSLVSCRSVLMNLAPTNCALFAHAASKVAAVKLV